MSIFFKTQVVRSKEARRPRRAGLPCSPTEHLREVPGPPEQPHAGGEQGRSGFRSLWLMWTLCHVYFLLETINGESSQLKDMTSSKGPHIFQVDKPF